MSVVLPRGVDHLYVTFGGVGEYRLIGGHERDAPVTGRGDDEPIGGIGVEFAGQAHTVDRDDRLDGHQIDAWHLAYRLYPVSEIHCDLQATLLDQEGDLPGRDGRDRNGVRMPRFLSEEMIYHEGQLMSPSFSEYLIPTSMGVPRVECIILESRSGLGPFGAKGIGEPALTPVAPAIANAVAHAIGARVPDLPLTPEKVLMALREKSAAG